MASVRVIKRLSVLLLLVINNIQQTEEKNCNKGAFWNNKSSNICRYLKDDTKCPLNFQQVPKDDDYICLLISEPQEYSDLCYRNYSNDNDSFVIGVNKIKKAFNGFKKRKNIDENVVWLNDRFHENASDDNYWTLTNKNEYGSLEYYHNCYKYNFTSNEISLDDCSKKFPIMCEAERKELLLPLACPSDQYSTRIRELQEYCFSIEFVSAIPGNLSINNLFDPVSKVKLDIFYDLSIKFNLTNHHACLVNLNKLNVAGNSADEMKATIDRNADISLEKRFNCIIKMQKLSLVHQPKMELQVNVPGAELLLIVHWKELLFRNDNDSGIFCYIGMQNQLLTLQEVEGAGYNETVTEYKLPIDSYLPQKYQCFGRMISTNELIKTKPLSLENFAVHDLHMYSILANVPMEAEILSEIVNNKSYNTEKIEQLFHIPKIEDMSTAQVKDVRLYEMYGYNKTSKYIKVNLTIATNGKIHFDDLKKLLKSWSGIELISTVKISAAELKGNYRILNIMTKVGNIISFISITFLIINSIFHSAWMKLLKNEIIINFSLSITMQTTAFVIGSFFSDYLTRHRVCALVGCLIQYFLLVTFTWPLIIAIRQYTLYGKNVSLKYLPPNYFRRIQITVWGLPALLPITLYLIMPENYSSSSVMFFADTCYPRDDARVIGNLIPIGILVNTSTLILIVTIIKIIRNNIITESTKKYRLVKLREPIILISFLHTTWLCGVLATSVDKSIRIYFEYGVTLTAPFFGFLAFILYFIRDPMAWQFWIKRCTKNRKQNYSNSSLQL